MPQRYKYECKTQLYIYEHISFDVFWSHFEVDQLTELVMSCTNTNIYYNEDAQILQAQKCKYVMKIHKYNYSCSINTEHCILVSL